MSELDSAPNAAEDLSIVIAMLRCLLTAVGVIATIAWPGTSVHADWHVVGQIGGPTSAVAVQAPLAYVAVGFRLHVYDMSDPAAVFEIGSTPPFGDFLSDVAVIGSRAYVTAGKDGLHILDISDPAAPREIGRWDSPGSAEGIAVDGDLAYLADGPFGLQIIDVSNPAAPHPRSSAFDSFFAFDVVVQNRVVFVAAAGAGVLVVDASDAAHPRELPIVETPGYARGLAIANATLYVADEWGGVRIMSIAEPAQTRELGVIPVQSWAFAVALSGSTLYVAAGSEGLQVFDTTDPDHPQKLSAYDMPWNLSWKITLADNRAFLGVRTQGVTILDVRNPSSPQRLGSIAPLSNAQAVAARGSLAFVATQSQGMRIVDFSDARKPRERGRGNTEGLTWAVVADEDRAYTCEGSVPNHYLRVFDTSNPDQPPALASTRIPQGHCRDLLLGGSTLYMPDEFGLQIWDVSSSSSPVLHGKLDTPGSGVDGTAGVESVDVVGAVAYVDTQLGVVAIEISDPQNPRLLGSWSGGELVSDVCAEDALVYATTRSAFPELNVIDATDPTRLTRVGVAALPASGLRVIVRDKKAYVAVGPAGVAVIDVSNPSAPVPTERIPLPGFAKELTFAGERILVASTDAGLLILESTSIASDAVARSSAAAPHLPRDMPRETRMPPTAPLAPKTLAIDPARAVAAGRAVVVTSPADSGPGTLREALMKQQSGDRITFDSAVFPPTAPVTIRPQTRLPPISVDEVTIDASNAGVVLEGSTLSGQFEAGIEIESRRNTIQGMQIVNFPYAGIYIRGNGGNVIGGDRSRGMGPSGEGNVISRNRSGGIEILNPNGNRIVGNLIGTDITGLQALGGQRIGVDLFHQPGNGDETGPDRIGGTETWESNVIAGNEGTEVYLHNARGHAVIGNYLGTDPTGSVRVGTAEDAIATSFASGNVIADNVMAGGVFLIDAGSHCNLLTNNWIGVTKSGVALTTNPYAGAVSVYESFNAIVGNRSERGFWIESFYGNPAETVVIGNTIGGRPLPENPPGTQAGVRIDSAWRTFIGGATGAERNEISGMTLGIWIGTPGIDRTLILGNTIHDTVDGIDVGLAASSILQGNLITDNDRGVRIASPAHQLRRNSIYANRSGAIAIDGAAGTPEPPVIVEVTLASVRGTACPGCTVEIYSDAGAEGRWYEGTATADAAGAFSFATPAILRGPNVTATATDLAASTSALSEPSPRPPTGPRRRTARH